MDKVLKGMSGSGRFEGGFSQYIQTLRVKIVRPLDPVAQLAASRIGSISMIRKRLGNGLKLAQILSLEFVKNVVKDNGEMDEIVRIATFQTRPVALLRVALTASVLMETSSEIVKRIDGWIAEGSNWRVRRVTEHLIRLYKYQPISMKINAT